MVKMENSNMHAKDVRNLKNFMYDVWL